MRVTLAVVTTLVFAAPLEAQRLPPNTRAAQVRLTRQPILESAHDDLAIVRWTVTNPGGLDVHYGVVRYGTDPKELTQSARSPIRLNRGHSETDFRVRLSGLRPGTRYYYQVTSVDSVGASDGVKSAVTSFTTPGANQRFHAQRTPQRASLAPSSGR